MELIDKAPVKAEIEKLEDEAKIYPSSFDCGRLSTCKELMNFIDTLETKEVGEPSKNLEEAAKFYTATHTEFFDSECKPHVAPAFIAGAKWQEEQIMKDAIEREVKEDAGGYPYIDATELYDYENDKPLAKAGDKVKVLIIKE